MIPLKTRYYYLAIEVFNYMSVQKQGGNLEDLKSDLDIETPKSIF